MRPWFTTTSKFEISSKQDTTVLLENILASMEQGVVAFDADGIVIAINERFLTMRNVPAELCMPGRHFLDLARYLAARGDYGPGDPELLAQERFRKACTAAADGLYRSSSIEPTTGRVYEVTGRSMPGGGFVNTYTDITEMRAAENALRESEARFRLLAEHSGDVVCLSNMEGTRLYVSPAAERVLGWRAEQMVGKKAMEFVHPEDQQFLQDAHANLNAGIQDASALYRYRRPDGSWLWVEGHARLHMDANGEAPKEYVVVLRDATERKADELKLLDALERMKQMAVTDGLTEIANRRHLDEVAAREWRRCSRDHLPLSVLLVDVDHFKPFNDRYGHRAGDDCLRAVAAQLVEVARRPGDLPARYGGEEFVLLMPNTSPDGALRVAANLRGSVQNLAIPHDGNSAEGVVTISIGVSTAWPSDQMSACRNIDTLLSAADAAMYHAKRGGRNQVVVTVCPSHTQGLPPAVSMPLFATPAVDKSIP